jgi:hypothetical protein
MELHGSGPGIFKFLEFFAGKAAIDKKFPRADGDNRGKSQQVSHRHDRGRMSAIG